MSKPTTKNEFEKMYIDLSGEDKEWYEKYYVTLPCNCGESRCDGWAAVDNNERDILHHKRLYI